MGKEGYRSVEEYKKYLETLSNDEMRLTYVNGMLSNSTKPVAPGSRELVRRNISRESYEFLLKKRAELSSRFFGKKKNLATVISQFVAISGIIGGLLFFSNNLTGNVIGISSKSCSLIGTCLLLIGLVSGFFGIKNKNS